jgi:hypothetical protein
MVPGLILVGVPVAFGGTVVNAPAPMWGVDPAGSNASDYLGVMSNAFVRWSIPHDQAFSPNLNGLVLDSNGVLFTQNGGPYDSRTGALVPPGNLVSSDMSTPAISSAGDIYQWEGGRLHAYHSDRTTYWTGPVTNFTDGRGVKIGPNGNVYANGGDGSMRVYSPAGALLWSRPINIAQATLPAFDAAGNCYYATGPAANPNYSYVSYDPQGNLRWTAPLAGQNNDPLRVGPDGNCYTAEAGPLGSTLIYVRDSATGSVLRQFNSLGHGAQSIGANGTLYTANLHTVAALSATGATLWSASVTSDIFIDALVSDRAGNVFCQTEENQVLAFSSTGAQLWSVQLPASGFQSLAPMIGTDGTIYVLSGSYLSAIGGTVPSPTTPMILVVVLGCAARHRR